MKEKIGVVVDSPADFPDGVVEKLGIHILPVHIHVDGEDHLHGKSISNSDVYRYLSEDRDVHTAPFFPSECADVYESLLDRYDRIVSLHLSTHLSGDYRAARGALNLLYGDDARRVHVIDLQTVSASQGLVVSKAVELLRRGCHPESLSARLEPYLQHTRMWFTVENLTWLKKGGRVSSFSAFVGRMLDIKPIICLENARLVPTEKHRGKGPALKRLVEMAAEACDLLGGNCRFWLAHTDNLGEVMLTREKLAASTGRKAKDIDLVEVGATIAVHTGPGSVCLAMSPN